MLNTTLLNNLTSNNQVEIRRGASNFEENLKSYTEEALEEEGGAAFSKRRSTTVIGPRSW